MIGRRLLLFLITLTFVSSICQAAEQGKPDPRLEEKVTYDGGYKRLHYVLDDLSRLTGVRIRAGKNKSDWMVRDIPVIVFVKDMPLGKCLQAIADATHTQVFRRDTSEGLTSYSIYRSPESEKDVTGPLDPKQARLIGKALKIFGPDAKDRVFAGENLAVKASKNPSLKAVLKEIFPTICAANVSDASHGFAFIGKAAQPTEKEIENSVFIMSMFKQGGSISIYVTRVPVIDREGRKLYDHWHADPVNLATPFASVEGLNLPPKPDVDPDAKPREKYPKGTVVLQKDEEWDLPALSKRIEMKLPEGKKHPNREDVLRALYEASGLNIICEDFVSHRYGFYAWPKTDFGKEPTPVSVLKAFNVPVQDPGPWFWNEDDNLLIGWAGRWRNRHTVLVPESVLAPIIKKANGEGAELDDLVLLVWLSTRQKLEWVSGTEELAALDPPFHPESKCFWKLYDRLKPRDKMLAKSADSLKLGKLDVAWVRDFLNHEMAIDSDGVVTMAAPEDNPEGMKKLEMLSDPQAISGLTLKIIKEPLEEWTEIRIDDEGHLERIQVKASPGFAKHTYSLEVTGGDDQKFHLKSTWQGTAFPVHSPRRDAELRENKGSL